MSHTTSKIIEYYKTRAHVRGFSIA